MILYCLNKFHEIVIEKYLGHKNKAGNLLRLPAF